MFRALSLTSRLTAVALLVPVAGCGQSGWYGPMAVPVEPPSTWKRVEPTRWNVPGAAVAAWSGPDQSSLVVYQTLPTPGGTAAMLVESLANRMDNLPGVRIIERRTETVAGVEAARVELVAPGTGDALAPSGAGSFVAPEGRSLVATRQVTLGFPRDRRTIFVRWHAPESSYDRIAPDIAATLRSVRLGADMKRGG